MGDMADDMRDWEMLNDPNFFDDYRLEVRPKPTKRVWITRDGIPVEIRKMTNSHLINTIRLLRRRGVGEREKDTPFYDTMLKVARKRRLTR